MKPAAPLLVVLLLAACQMREPIRAPLDQMSDAKLPQALAELEATLSPEVREKFAELRKQSDALPRPTSLGQDTLRSIRDQDLDFAVSWYFAHRIRTTGGTRESVLTQEPQAVQTYYLVLLLESEVLNGGFNQYFWNVSPELVARTPAALRELGATEVLDLFDRAAARGREESGTRASYKAQRSLQAFSDSYKSSRLNEYDAKFVEAAKDLPARRTVFVRANEAKFSRQQP